MLHGLVESILRTVIDSDSEVLKKAVRRSICHLTFESALLQLFAESKLVDCFIRGHKLNQEAWYELACENLC
jgi:hypothetical protein